jgi:hypothetical protein
MSVDITSGKLVIIAIAALALAAAGASWWFRYAATHQAAEFYGDHVLLIRDAPVVELLRIEPSSPGGFVEGALRSETLDRFLDAPTNRRDISTTPGLTHLRAALLDDRSYNWPSRPDRPSDRWKWILIFRNEQGGAGAILMFSPDWLYVTVHGHRVHKEQGTSFQKVYVSDGSVVSCEPIAAGLAEMLEDLALDAPEVR